METLRVLTFVAMVILEAIMMIIIAFKNRNIQGENAFKLALSLLGMLIMSTFFAYKYFALGEGWSSLVGFGFMIVMGFTYFINEFEVAKYNAKAYNESRHAFKIIAWISAIVNIAQIIAVMPKGNPYWVSGDFFYWKLNHYI